MANQPQTRSLLSALAEVGDLIGDRTWQSWFALSPPFPQVAKLACLDRYALQLELPLFSGSIQIPCYQGQKAFFGELVYGGLLQAMLAPTEAPFTVHTLMQRALEYQPKSELHLHFDAIDAAAWHDDYRGIPWSAISAIAADRVLQLLDDRWSPRNGSVYAGFRTNLDLKWATASETQRKEIRQMYAGMIPDLFDHFMTCGATPDWSMLGIKSDSPHEHIYKLLFALAAAPTFLVEDRLQAWSLDLATSALAMHARAWTNRYKTMVLGTPPELQYWVAFYEIFFSLDSSEIDCRAIDRIVVGEHEDSWVAAPTLFQKARSIYWEFLNDLGLAPSEVCAGLLKTRDARPLIFC